MKDELTTSLCDECGSEVPSEVINDAPEGSSLEGAMLCPDCYAEYIFSELDE